MAKKNDKISSQPELRAEQLEKVSGGAYVNIQGYNFFFDENTGEVIGFGKDTIGVESLADAFGVSADKWTLEQYDEKFPSE